MDGHAASSGWCCSLRRWACTDFTAQRGWRSSPGWILAVGGNDIPGSHICAAMINMGTAALWGRLNHKPALPADCLVGTVRSPPASLHLHPLAPQPDTISTPGRPQSLGAPTLVPSLRTWDQDVPESKEGEGPVTQGQWRGVQPGHLQDHGQLGGRGSTCRPGEPPPPLGHQGLNIPSHAWLSP